MHLYVYYLKQTYPQDFIISLLADVLGFDKSQIAELSLPGEFKLRYEHRYLDPAEFNAELSIFCWENDFESRTGGRVQLGSRISQYIQDEVVVKYREEDPHQWVLIGKDRFYVVPEKVGDNIGINLHRDQAAEAEPLKARSKHTWLNLRPCSLSQWHHLSPGKSVKCVFLPHP